MAQSDEEKAADDQVTAALENWLRVHQYDGSAVDDGDPRVLTDYVVMMATQGWRKDGQGVTGYPYLVRDNMPIHRTLGLVQVSLEFMATTLHEEDDDD